MKDYCEFHYEYHLQLFIMCSVHLIQNTYFTTYDPKRSEMQNLYFFLASVCRYNNKCLKISCRSFKDEQMVQLILTVTGKNTKKALGMYLANIG